MNEAWAEVAVDRERTLLYSPRFGRLYLLSARTARDRVFLRLTGLAAIERCDALLDPADHITPDPTGPTRVATSAVPALLPAAYWLMRLSRYVMTLRVAAFAVRRAAIATGSRAIAQGATNAEIGRLVRTLQGRAGTGDCYARALLTAFLCLCARRSCTLAVGVLAPTRKMHAWCGVDGELPYEPLPEHFLYQPVWTLELTP